MSAYELAQLNIGIIKGPMDSPLMADFANNLERINAVAATAIRPFDDPNLLVNMSVWRDVASLNTYVYSSAHVEIMRRRREFFERMDAAFLVLWWVPRGHRPTVDEAMARLELLRAQGPSAQAFSFRHAFPPPDASPTQPRVSFDDTCPAT
jgi:hypothetical protein